MPAESRLGSCGPELFPAHKHGVSMTQFDYVIVGAGPAGCVLANRLSADPAISVLLLEAGGEDTNPLIAMPRGFAELFGDPATAWHYPTRPFGPSQQIESWVRGKALGGSSSVNGMIYNRGHAGDYDALERLGNPGWGWDDMLPVFQTIEDNPLGASATRGAGGPLRVSTVDGTDPLLEDVITAGTKRGWRRALDLNDSDQERIGYAMATIRDGRRVNAATAFLHPVIDRPNLTVGLHTLVDQVLLEDGRAVGVCGRRNGHGVEAQATREVILAAGSIATPKILHLSGIGPADVLKSAGVDVVVDSPNVGARMREHRVFLLQFRLADDLGYNKILSTEAGQQAAAAEYQATQSGPLAAPSFDIVGFFKTRPDLSRPDAQFQIAPFSTLPLEPGKALTIEREPGMMCVAYLRGRTARAASGSPRRTRTRRWTSTPTTTPPNTTAAPRWASSAASAGCSAPHRSRTRSSGKPYPATTYKPTGRSSTPG
jgi:choline dehydrogenase